MALHLVYTPPCYGRGCTSKAANEFSTGTQHVWYCDAHYFEFLRRNKLDAAEDWEADRSDKAAVHGTPPSVPALPDPDDQR